MPKSVKFAETLVTPEECPVEQLKTFPHGIMRKPGKVDPGPPTISNIYLGGVKVSPRNFSAVYKNTVKVMQAASYTTSESTQETIPSQENLEYPSCFEIWTVLNLILRAPLDEKPSEGPPVHPNQLLLWAKRDLLQYKNTDDVLNSRVIVQILKAVDYIFYADASRQSINADTAKFFLEEALQGIITHTTSKPMLAICLHIFNHIHLPKLLDANIAIRLLKCIHTRSQQSRSNSLSGDFLSAFKVLLKHHKPLMIKNVKLWVSVMFSTLADQSSCVRLQGQALVNEVVRLKSPEIAWAVVEFFSSIPAHLRYESNSCTWADIIADRMIKTLEIAEEAKGTLSTWSALMIMFDCDRSINLEVWGQLPILLQVPRMGFASASRAIKEATMCAWNSVLYLFIFRYDYDTSITRNIASLTAPVIPKKQTSLAIVERAIDCFNTCLFLALRTCDISMKHLDTTFKYLVQPFISGLVENSNERAKVLAFQYLRDLTTLPPGSKTTRQRALDINTMTTKDFGGFPKNWVRKNLDKITSLLVEISPHANFDSICELWDKVVAIVRQGSSSGDDEVYQQLLDCIDFLSDVSTQFSAQQNSQLFSTFACSFSYDLLTNPHYRIDKSGNVKISKKGNASCATILLSPVMDSSAPELDTMLKRFAISPSRQVALLAKTILSQKSNANFWKTGVLHIVRLMAEPTFGKLEEEDCSVILDILEDSAASQPQHWMDLFEITFRHSRSPEWFSDFMENIADTDGCFALMLELRKTLFQDVDTFDQFFITTCFDRHPQKLDQIDKTYPVEFRVSTARYLFETNSVENMEKSIAILPSTELKENADLFIDAIERNSKSTAIKHWIKLFCGRKALPGVFSTETVQRARKLYQKGVLTRLPEDIPAVTPSKRSHETTSSPNSPSVPMTPVKRFKGSITNIGGTISPPRSSAHEFESEELPSSPPLNRKSGDIRALYDALDAPDLGQAIKGMRRQQLLELRAQLQQTLDFVEVQISKGS